MIFALNALLLGLMQDQSRFVLSAAGAGFVADLLLHMLRPTLARPARLRLFAFSVPATVYLLYLLVLDLSGGIWWTIHFWLGSAVMAGITGFLPSYLLLPPPIRVIPSPTDSAG